MSESAYYAYFRHKSPKRNTIRQQIELKVAFNQSRGSAGSRTLSARLKAQGFQRGRYWVRQQMKLLGLVSKQPRKWRYCSQMRVRQFDNLVERRFEKTDVANALCGDVTYLKVKGKWHYLAAVLHLATRQIVGWSLAERESTELVIEALDKAVNQVRPKKAMLFHSDQGAVFSSLAFCERVKKHQLIQSMSRRGNCWDNAVMERWFRSFKYEWLPQGGYSDIESARKDVEQYIDYYNHIRPHQYHQGATPVA